MNQTTINKSRYIKITSFILSILYISIIIVLLYTNDLFKDIYSNTKWIELSFTLFITYLILYFKDAFIMDFIEIVIEKQEKHFLLHLLEHTLEPAILLLFFMATTRLLLFLNTDSVLLRILVVIVTPALFFLLKKTVFKDKKNDA